MTTISAPWRYSRSTTPLKEIDYVHVHVVSLDHSVILLLWWCDWRELDDHSIDSFSILRICSVNGFALEVSNCSPVRICPECVRENSEVVVSSAEEDHHSPTLPEPPKSRQFDDSHRLSADYVSMFSNPSLRRVLPEWLASVNDLSGETSVSLSLSFLIILSDLPSRTRRNWFLFRREWRTSLVLSSFYFKDRSSLNGENCESTRGFLFHRNKPTRNLWWTEEIDLLRSIDESETLVSSRIPSHIEWPIKEIIDLLDKQHCEWWSDDTQSFLWWRWYSDMIWCNRIDTWNRHISRRLLVDLRRRFVCSNSIGLDRLVHNRISKKDFVIQIRSSYLPLFEWERHNQTYHNPRRNKWPDQWRIFQNQSSSKKKNRDCL